VKRFLRSSVAWLFLAVLAGFALWLERQRGETFAGDGAAIYVIDGDSLRVESREVRLAGIDAPEYRQSCTDAAGAAWPCGREARTALERIVRGGAVSCRTAQQDRYGRALALCWAGKEDVATLLARQGWADGAGDARF
jgi:endonuclease YncB( thermonuclease family)